MPDKPVKPESNQCFIICPIGEPKSDIRKRSDLVFKHVFNPLAKTFDLKPMRADLISKQGMITDQVIQCILNDRLVIADLTGSNPNVFYEVALRHALKKPMVLIADSKQKIPFDLHGLRVIPFDYPDLDNVEGIVAEIAKHVKTELEKKEEEVFSPFTNPIQIQDLKQSIKPLDKLTMEVIELKSQISDLMKNSVTQMEHSKNRIHVTHDVVDNHVFLGHSKTINYLKKFGYKYLPNKNVNQLLIIFEKLSISTLSRESFNEFLNDITSPEFSRITTEILVEIDEWLFGVEKFISGPGSVKDEPFRL
jgi:hypothetical protein